jgi:DNA-binding transcriptional MerR regulator
MTAERAHRSIGEVLSLLHDEFPDVTISKIRFLESQGLLEPERTPSGYRKFFDPDVDRLRWILVHQRDHFLPLKVIKERLDSGAFDDWVEAGADPAMLQVHPVQPALELVMDDGEEPPPPPPPPMNGVSAVSDEDRSDTTVQIEAVGLVEVAGPAAPPPPPVAPVTTTAERPDDAATMIDTADDEAEEHDVTEDPHRFDVMLSSARRVVAPLPEVSDDEEPAEVAIAEADADAEQVDAGVAPVPELDPGPLDPGATSVSMTVEELSRASGLTPLELEELERYGLLTSRPVGPAVYYDGEALVVSKLAAAFLRHGIEARHLRMYKTAAEREAGVFEQVVAPLVGRKDGASRREARERLVEMARLGEALHAALLRTSLRGYGEGS